MSPDASPLLPAVAGLADDYFDHLRRHDQSWWTARGDLDQIAAWDDLSTEAMATRQRQLGEYARRADALGGSLAGMDRTIVASIGFHARAMSSLVELWRDLTWVQGASNFVDFLANDVACYRLATRAHGDDYVAKLRGLPAFVDGWCEALRARAAAGWRQTGRGLAATVTAIDVWLAGALADDPLLAQAPPTELSAVEVERWRDAAATAVRDAVRPALSTLRALLIGELAAVARSDDQAGICSLPDGEELYRHLLWVQTSSRITPDEVHQLGLDALAVLDAEYAVHGRATFGISDPSAVRVRVRDDPALHYSTAEEIVDDSRAVLERAWSLASSWFRRLPSSGCDVLGVQGGPFAYYITPPPDHSAPGKFCCNVADPTKWSRADLAATACHEGIPGHHLQLALALESELHPVLHELFVVSTAEGWGLYAERLADEMGVYATSLERLGMLATNSLRASRLVVDSGLHAMGWSRQRALDFFVANTTLDVAAAADEIDRYIAEPGQASAYMVGRVVFDELRAQASVALGDRFSLPDFHDVVLGSGSPPLDELRQLVADWIGAA